MYTFCAPDKLEIDSLRLHSLVTFPQVLLVILLGFLRLTVVPNTRLQFNCNSSLHRLPGSDPLHPCFVSTLRNHHSWYTIVLLKFVTHRVVGLVPNSAPLWKNNGKAPQVFCLRNSWSAFPLSTLQDCARNCAHSV